MRIVILLAFISLQLVAQDYATRYGFEFKNGDYHLVKLKEGQKGLCLGKICSIDLLYAEGNRTFASHHNQKINEAINIYENNLFFLPENGLVLGNLESEKLNKNVHSSSTEEAFGKLLEDKRAFLENEEFNHYGNDFSQRLKITKITKDRIFFDNFVDFSYSASAHPSFYTSGFALDTQTLELKTYILSDVIEDGPKFRAFISGILKKYLQANKEEWADWDERDYFGADEFGFNLFEQEVVFKEKGLYINLRALLSEAGRGWDFFEVPYEDLRAFARGDLQRLYKSM